MLNNSKLLFEDIEDQKNFLKLTIGDENVNSKDQKSWKRKLENLDFKSKVNQFISQWIQLNVMMGDSKKFSIETLEMAKTKANQLFLQKEFEKASKYYSMIICSQLPLNFIEIEKFKALQSLCFSNRALCLLKMNENLKKVVNDFERARQNYPKNKLSSLLVRLASSKIDLAKKQNNFAEKELLLVEALKDIEDSKQSLLESIESSKTLENDLKIEENRAKELLSKINKQKPTTTNDTLPQTKESFQLEGSNSNEILTIEFNVEEGRFLKSTNSNSFGKTILSEKAYAAILYDPFQNRYCHFCFTQSNHLSPCSKALLSKCCALYCSDMCEKTAWKQYHELECGVSKLLPRYCSDELRLAIRILFTARLTDGKSFEEILTTTTKSPESFLNPTTLIDIPGMNGNKWKSSFSSIYSLHSHLNSFDNELLSKTIANALIGSTICDVPVLVVAHVLAILKTNMFAITEMFDDGSDKTKQISTQQVRIGGGMFVSASLFNHSCSPNCIVTFNGRELSVKNLSKTTNYNLTICYGPRVGRHTTSERKKILREQYFFECNCFHCQNGLDDFCFRHTNCSTTKSEEQGPGRFSGLYSTGSCLKCNEKIDSQTISNSNLRATLLNKKFNSLEIDFEKRKTSEKEIMNKALELLNESKQLFVETHSFIGKVCDFVVRVHVSSPSFSNTMIPIEELKMSLSIVGENFGIDSIEFANESLKYSTIMLEEAKKHKQNPKRSNQHFTSFGQFANQSANNALHIFKQIFSKQNNLILECMEVMKESQKYLSSPKQQ